MPPKAANPGKRKGPVFKPPRPVKPAQPAQAQAPAKRPAAAPPRAAAPSKKPAQSRPAIDITMISSSEEEEEDDVEDAFSNSDPDEEMDDALEDEAPRRAAQPVPAEDEIKPIPQKLLTKILFENMEDKGMQMNKGALQLVDKYMNIFVQEAIARAQAERDEADKAKGGITDGFLQVEDLEKLAPQLVLDF